MRNIGLALLLGSTGAPAQEGPAPAPTLGTVEVRAERAAPGSSLGLDIPQDVGSRLGLTPRETPASVSAMDAEDIAGRDLTRAQDVATRMPGITESPAPGNGGTSLSARGFVGHNSVAQLIDGTRLAVAAGTVTYPFSTWPLASVEVLRGPASVLYGDGAIGAAVNYVTRKPAWNRTHREAFLTAGSHGQRQGGVGLRGPVNDAAAYSVYLDAAGGDGYRALEEVERRNYALALSVRPASGLAATFSLDGGMNDDARYFGTPLRGGSFDDRVRRINYNVSDAVVRYDDRLWRAKVEYRAGPDVRLRNETYHATSERHWRNAESYGFDRTGGSVIRSDYLEILHDLQQTGNRLDVSIDGSVAGLPNRFVAGVDWHRTRLLHTNNAPYRGASAVDPYAFDPGVFDSPDPTKPGRQARLRTTALYAENALDLAPRWKLVGGLRHERTRLDDDNLRTAVRQRKSYAPTTGRIGLVWTASETLSFYGQYATGTDPLSGALSLPGGGTVFDLTRGRQAEVGAKGLLPAIRGEWTAAAYRIDKRHLLSRDPDEPGVVRQVGHQSSTGLELAFAAEPVSGWTVDANAAWLRARYEDFDEASGGTAVSRRGNVPVGVPERTAHLWTTYRLAPRWRAGAGLRYVGARFTNAANSGRLPGYTVADASLAYEHSSALRLMLSVRNLADRTYPVSGSGSTWLLGAPRTVQLTLRATF
ncbi:TonB-dependent receptor [Paracidovorax citrulli]|uniref:TonB-dependent siderophore receptor n=2 Tax=Paracidovorax citrulli TaxID=80869 RepID=A1TNU8_PARC0|nr:TonB-dependent receptor [Paracidovorax citrulli]ABM32636.1 TonB-dependent siderophore receptor [Paracidovorax citrulli AAC00-1]ATG93356.1 TonB-dependent siderophore receptor [Paracidovorax citrulli]PVY66853.1 iron complex outermembrane receptor protein [Paracidovorax citrulli]QCX09241.1 Fe(3+)-pyochelin receptor [Paracidovorax citrulli]REG68984.1 iron complex outermembrane receptor protein [Paracidovorax citrulli]